MARVRLIHWRAAEAAERIEALRKAGHEVAYDERLRPALIRAGEPQVVVIDLTRMPSHGREVGVYLRSTKASRHIPIVFAGGEPDKVARVREMLPDATYVDWEGLPKTLKKALASAPADVVVPKQMMERYGDRTVAQKLGIEAGAEVTVIESPRNFPALLGELPEDVRFTDSERRPGAVTLWFIRTLADYQSAIMKRRTIARQSKLWVVWPKGEAGKRAGLAQNIVRETALDCGLVDYKTCAVDETWTAMLFTAAKNR